MKKLLLVEDDAKISLALGMRLRHYGFELHTAPDAVSAMAKAVQHAPDMILLDINLPGGDGFLVAERLRARPETASIPFVFITASKLPNIAQRAAACGAVALIEKPFSTMQLLDVITDKLSKPDLAA